jgi:YidC/Oxa1 family membrane protein insertase
MLANLKNILIACKKNNNNYTFYSEGVYYQKYYYSFISLLNNNNEKVFYISSDKKDTIELKNVTNVYVGEGILRTLFFLFVKTTNFFLTVTDLENNILKKNSNVKNYIYVFHAAISIHKSYTKSAFNNYDTILCIGDYHVKEILEQEKIYNLPKKKLIKAGYFYFDYLLSKASFDTHGNKILIAPSWNYSKKNFLNNQCEDLIEYLINKKFDIIFRPHPEHYKRSSLILDKIRHKFNSFNNFQFDNSIDNYKSMDNSHTLITDNSGISIEFLIVFKKPVIFFDKFSKIHNPQYNFLSSDIFEENFKNKFGFRYSKDKLINFDNEIKKAQLEFNLKKIDIEKFIDKNIYNFGSSAAKVYEQLKD